MMKTVESSFICFRQIDPKKVNEKFDDLKEVLSNGIMKNSVTIRILQEKNTV